MRLAYRTAALFLTVTVSALVSCGGQGLSTTPDAAFDAAWPGHSWEGGARSGAFVAVAVDSTERNVVELTQRLRLETSSNAAGTVVTVYGRDVQDSSAYLHLKYDATKLHPVEAQRGALLDENVLFLGITTQPGVVDLGIATVGGAPVSPGDVELAQVRFAPGAFEGVRAVSVAPSQAPTDVHFVGSELHWSYNQSGDFDQNSETNIADLSPLGLHLGHSTSDGVHDSADVVVDGDHNGEVTLAELGVIGANFLRHTGSYRIETAPTDAGPFSLVADGNVTQSAGEAPVGGGFLQYAFDFSPQDMAYYAVRVMDGAEQGPLSNRVQFGVVGGGPPQNLSASDDGAKITLDWDAPAGAPPTGYDAYVSGDAGMAGALKMNGTTLTGTTFDCSPIAVPVGAEHYFAVVADYDGTPSGYSNVFHYGGGGGVDAPTGLAAVKEGNQIRLSWNAVSGADSYNAYVSDDSGMSGAVIMNLPGQITTATFLCPAVAQADPANEHYFAVTTVTGTDESGNSNIAHYTPGGAADITAPQFQGGLGIRSAEPDNGKVKIYWYPAIDPAPGTPPVQYLIYFSPEGTPIDWGNPSDVVDSPATNYTVPGLTNGQRYEFAVRAQDGVPNQTSNENSIFAKPGPFPTQGQISDIVSSDIASVRMPGEEVPRVFAVTHGSELWYATYDGSAWQTVDLNTTIAIAARKYHPQAIGVGDEIHILFATGTGLFEFYGGKDADPATWTLSPVATAGMSSCFGTGFAYSSPQGVGGEYFAAVFAGKFGGEEKLYYTERSPAGLWSVPELIMDGDPSIWQCDMAISEATGAQWVVACNGPQVSQDVDVSPNFWYVTRPNHGSAWGSATDTGKKSSTEITVRIDPLINQPVVVNPETHWYDVFGGLMVPATSAAIYSWNGTSWADEPSSPIDDGNGFFDGSQAVTTADRGRDPQLIFAPSGKAVAIFTNVDISVDIIEGDYTLEGSWNLTERPALAWSKPSSNLRTGIYSSNSVTAGESYQHCLTCYVAPADSGDEAYVSAKYATRNDYPEGDLYYFHQPWP
jgi:hypothetical protein